MAIATSSVKPLADSIESNISPPKKQKVVDKKHKNNQKKSSSSSSSSSSSNDYEETSKSRDRSRVSMMEETMKRVDETVEGLAAGDKGPKGKIKALTPRS